MLTQAIKDFYQQDMNCAETLTLAGNAAYGLELDAKTMKLMSGFGGGCGCGNLCGALAGALGILSVLTVQERAHATPDFGALCGEFMERYQQKMGSALCAELKPKYRTEELKCMNTCLLTGEVLAEFLAEKGLVK